MEGVNQKERVNRILNRIKSFIFPVKVDERLVDAQADKIGSMSMGDLSRSYDDIRRASLLCEKSLKIAGVRADLAAKQQVLKEKLNELIKFETMTDEEKKHISNILEKYKHVTAERKLLRNQISGFTKILDYLEPYEKEVEGVIVSMDEAEDKQRRVKQDINYIEGERSELEYEKQDLEKMLVIIYRLAIGLVAFFSIIAVGLLYLYLGRGIEIFMVAFLCAAAVIILTTLLYIFRRRVIYEDKLNVLLQIRAVELLNRKKVIYVHYTSFLNYEYKKYRVKSAYELKEIWKEYGYYKHVSSRYTNIRNIVYTIEDELHAFLRKHGLQKTKTSVESFEKILNFEANKKQFFRFSQQLELTETKLSMLESDQANIWAELNELKERDTTENKAIESMMSEYFEDIGKVMPVEDEKDEFDYTY